MDLNGHPIPATLQKLLDFDAATNPHEYYTAGLEMDPEMDQTGITCGWEHPDILNHFICFATAEGTGSLYAFWLRNGNEDLEQAPIVFMGSEGECAVAAKNIRDLLRLMSCDIDPMPWQESYLCYYKDEDYEPSPGIADYRGWVKETMELELMDHEEAEAYNKALNEEWGKEFQDLLNRLLD